MKVTSLVLPSAVLEDAHQLAYERGRKPAVILRRAVVLGLADMLEDKRPKQEPKRERE